MRYLVVAEYVLSNYERDQEVIFEARGRNAYKRAKQEYEDILCWYDGGEYITLLKDYEDGSSDILDSKENKCKGDTDEYSVYFTD